MRIEIMRIAAIAALVFGAWAMPCTGGTPGNDAQQSAQTARCDYTCLTGFVDQYLNALVAHDPSRLPVAAHVKFTENTIPLKLGDALWGTISGMGTYKIYFADPQASQVGTEVTIRENGTPAILVVRLKIADRKIAEVETVVRRGAEPAENLEKLGQPNPVWLQP